MQKDFLTFILITGTPGTGKTTISRLLAEKINYEHIDVSELIKTKKAYNSVDDSLQCTIYDEIILNSELCKFINKKPKIFDFHSAEVFDKKWLCLVVVLRTDNSILYERLQQRNYSKAKISENVEAEIMQVVLDDAFLCFEKDIVIELQNNNQDDIERIVKLIIKKLNLEYF